MQGGAHVEVTGAQTAEEKQAGTEAGDKDTAESSGSDVPGMFRRIVARLPFVNRTLEPVVPEEAPEAAEAEAEKGAAASSKAEATSEASEQQDKEQEEGEKKGLIARVLSWRPFSGKEEQQKAR